MAVKDIIGAKTRWKSEIYKKSYLIEFYSADSKDGAEPEEVFTFSVPPESEELTYSQRKTETKTFGGLHVDDYGIDIVKIMLSGSTVNQELKRIYRPGKSDNWLTGEEEIYLLRDLITRYKTGKKIGGKIMLYDLSKSVKHNRNNLNFNHLIQNYWRVFPGDFKIRRDSTKPFTYKYSIEFTGIQQGAGSIAERSEPIELSEEKTDILKSLMGKLHFLLDSIDGINGKINDVLAKIDEVSNLINTLGNVMKYATSAVVGAMNSAGQSAAGAINAATNVVEGVNSLVSLPRAVQLSAVNIGLEVFNATKGLVRATAALTNECRQMFTSEYWEIPQEVLDQYAMVASEFKDSVSLMLDNAENTANYLAAAAKSAQIPDVTIGNNANGTQNITLSYGNHEVTIKDTDTLESLAAAYYGNPDKAINIAEYNGITSLNELRPGDIIKIPITVKSDSSANNRIFARREDRDNYGRDIYLSDDGVVGVSASGDFRLIDKVDNLSQAVLLRLRESVNKRIRLNAYGIRKNISDPTAGIAYIMSSIDLTMRAEPRVRSVEDIRFTGNGDSLDVVVDYIDINNAAGNAGGSA